MMNEEFTEELSITLKKVMFETPFKFVISKGKNKNNEYKKIVIEEKEKDFQVAKYSQKQVFHTNITFEEIEDILKEYLGEEFLQLNAWAEGKEFEIKISKKKKIFFTSRKSSQKKCLANMEHNRKKNYIIPDGKPVLPLIDMGVFTKEGKIVNSMYDKYRQINRFIEIIDDEIKNKDFKHLNIIDFGCGKSYLTFVVYYYLTQIRNIKVNMTGLDLKEDVIKKCNETAKRYGYDNLRFELGDINGYKADFEVDMVISLHACDTATDYALFNAINWKSKMIFSVPCCQHELNKQLKPENLSIFSRYGIISERFSALSTDLIRANLLEYIGYDTQILEFVDFSHTPKNLLIRAVRNQKKSNEKREKTLEEVKNLMKEFGFEPTLYKLLIKQR
ncbi:Methyltransferase domain-containing protein [Acetitomaculum ruminis DSM 5522]|uniref:Methyltransferase domain-containing protein n=1 Tax=Acetitomaculum ruminis DSM 5522 TaxID=1120918 RepID=A0A1I0YVD7_9FIRM|nr:SAM-dependent methyltransferase [Acetitomaculum ruminis]SFB17355.1 Methyltransferase domain-containing protein [Acetitomaculum ruminis DSM 5522]